MNWLAAERSELGAERILDGAAQLFAEQGVGRPGMEDIARAAGCSRATVYRHFGTKQALLQAFVHREARDITEQHMATQRIEHLALHDPLPGLPNRLLLEDRIAQAI